MDAIPPERPQEDGAATALSAVERIGPEVARIHAAIVDKEARFPQEAIAALRAARVLSAAVPAELGGEGASIATLSAMCASLGQHCSSSAMVLAMHHIQVLSIADHRGDHPALLAYLRSLVSEQRLIASVTSEVGPSGDLRQSVAAVESTPDGPGVTKRATTISYGRDADDLLITARRGADASPGDQVLMLAPRGTFSLSEVGAWDTLGMRGTSSPGATVRVEGKGAIVVPVPFGEIATHTMVPASHVLWSSCWLGIATDAVAKAQAMVRKKARAQSGVVPRAAQRLAELFAKLQMMRGDIFSIAHEYDRLRTQRDVGGLSSIGFALRVNNLKLSASRLVVEIVGEALGICGISAYRNDSSESLGRQLRDAYSAALMIHNDRIHDSNASLLLVHKGT